MAAQRLPSLPLSSSRSLVLTSKPISCSLPNFKAGDEFLSLHSIASPSHSIPINSTHGGSVDDSAGKLRLERSLHSLSLWKFYLASPQSHANGAHHKSLSVSSYASFFSVSLLSLSSALRIQTYIALDSGRRGRIMDGTATQIR
jgi:hypothetical protein